MPARFPCSETSYHGPSMAGISQPCLRSGIRSNANALSKLHGMLLTASAVEADGLLQPSRQRYRGRRPRKIDQLMPIVAEIEQISSRRNSRLKSRAQISDGSGRRFFLVRRKKFALENQRVTIA